MMIFIIKESFSSINVSIVHLNSKGMSQVKFLTTLSKTILHVSIQNQFIDISSVFVILLYHIKGMKTILQNQKLKQVFHYISVVLYCVFIQLYYFHNHILFGHVKNRDCLYIYFLPILFGFICLQKYTVSQVICYILVLYIFTFCLLLNNQYYLK